LNQLPTSYQSFIALSRYARWIEKENRRETYSETVDRYLDFFDARALKFGCELGPVKDEIRDEMLSLGAMPSMRALMTAGPALEKDNVAGYNCAYVAIDEIKSFSEVLYILMCVREDTLVQTPNGPKKISELTLDEEIATLLSDGTTAFVKPDAIMESRLGSEDKKVKLDFDDGTSLTCTADHEVLTKNRGYVKAGELMELDDIQTC
jgi:hypothetical protein